MFSMIFGSGKKKTASDESLNNPPIPGARSEDDFVLVPGNSGGQSSIYPNIPGGVYPPQPAALRPAPQPPFHYLQGVPFRLCKELAMNEGKDSFSLQIGDILASAARKYKLEDFEYDFSLERSVLRE